MVSAEETLHWQGTAPGQVRLGSDAHKSLFTMMLRDTFNPYDPAQIEWPQLSPAEHRRLANLPFWNIAVETEAAAGARVCAYAREIADPDVRRAVELAGFEETRHSRLFIQMAAAYGIPVTQDPQPVPAQDREWAFMLWGIAEGLDSFFAFGLYEAASRSQVLPPRLIQVFGPVVQEEARHIVFFRNWIAWRKRTLPWWQRPIFIARLVSVWLFIVWKRLQTVRNLSGSQSLTMTGFTETGEQSLGIGASAAELLDLCFAESDRRLKGYDSRLLRPLGVPRILRFVRLFMRSPRRRAPALDG